MKVLFAMSSYSEFFRHTGAIVRLKGEIRGPGRMLPEPAVCQRARKARDPRFDGRFYVAVLTTGIYCRPVCPARLPAEENVRYYPSPASAQDAGFRPHRKARIRFP